MVTAQPARQEEGGSGAALGTDCPTVPKSKALGVGEGEGEGRAPAGGGKVCGREEGPAYAGLQAGRNVF